MMEFIIALVLGIAAGSFMTWLFVRKLPQDKIRDINYEQIQYEQRLLEEQKERERREITSIMEARVQAYKDAEDARRECEEMVRRINLLTIQKDVLSNEVSSLNQQRLQINDHLELSRQEAENAAKIFQSQQMEIAQQQLEISLEELGRKYQEDAAEYQEEYLKSCQDFVETFKEQFSHMAAESKKASEALEALKKAVDVATEAAKRDEEKRQEKDFYRLALSDSDLHEVSQLREVLPILRDKEALNKVIWKVYYEKPYTDMIGRILGQTVKTGIYKITNIENQMCYVGQAVNVADRWRQHIKRGLGAETPTRNKLYPAMEKYGVENFTFELLEECPRSELDAKEDAWQEFFHARDFGYSIK